MPKELNADQQKYVIGVQANLWTEYIQTPVKVEYMIIPRVFSLAEIAWSQPERKDLKNFSEERLPLHLARLDQTETNYWVPTPLGLNEKVMNGENFNIELKAPVQGSKIYYTLDLTRPSVNGNLYTNGVKVIVPKGEKRVLKTLVITPAGKQSVVTETILNNGAADVKAK
jgi:hexosaminidase